VLYEAPHRLTATLADLEAALGNRPVAIGRELTKLHEEVVRTSLSGAKERFTNQPPRGEFVLVIGAPEPETAPTEPEAAAALLRERLATGEAPSAAARKVARETGLPRRDLYRLATTLRTDIANGGK
jgi:16S rRNA (cytidine1402-2'-O)-methyltransferase